MTDLVAHNLWRLCDTAESTERIVKQLLVHLGIWSQQESGGVGVRTENTEECDTIIKVVDKVACSDPIETGGC